MCGTDVPGEHFTWVPPYVIVGWGMGCPRLMWWGGGRLGPRGQAGLQRAE